MTALRSVIPAQAGIQVSLSWAHACPGVTSIWGLAIGHNTSYLTVYAISSDMLLSLSLLTAVTTI